MSKAEDIVRLHVCLTRHARQQSLRRRVNGPTEFSLEKSNVGG